ncbi:YktB family protein [Thalassobacillus pellis]|uniref:YktB family protein n=1 Tax=Thalassobacillus pellis TaxID=748008 RepID=UPI00196130BB|nr:DUF1054 domain-containing protein [Thalassobacillus pellis]MBM7552909.1 uncharacterized protein YktB (UPF0637 family) [Thalassobacillus pellis]
MTNFQGFEEKDFNVFSIEGLDERMDALKTYVSPKLEQVAEELAPELTAMTEDEMFVHVARHARRTKNPPDDSWAALANSKRGYKKLPHFQIGLWETHLFLWFAVIYESPIKQDFAKKLKKRKKKILKEIPDNFVWSVDHTKPDTIPHKNLRQKDFDEMVDRLGNVKKAEILCGITIDRKDSIVSDGEAFLKTCQETFQQLEPLYQLAKE